MWAFLVFVGGMFGLGIMLVLLVLLMPEKVQIWSSWILRICLYFNEKVEYAYVSTNVAGHVNNYLQGELIRSVDGIVSNRVKIRWHRDADSLVHQKKGTLIVRMRPHAEQEVNVLHAIISVTPRIVAPEIRSRLESRDSHAIDLQLCRRCAESASRATMLAYRTHILDPAISSDPPIESVLEVFESIDQGGLFVPVFLQELNDIGRLYAADPCPGVDREVADFYQFLLNIAEREPGAEVPLVFVGEYIKVQVILVARASTKAFGLMPYKSRMSAGLARGAETVYLLATGANLSFSDRVAGEFEADGRLLYRKRTEMYVRRAGNRVKGIACRFEKNQGFSANELIDRLKADAGLEIGAHVTAVVTSVDEKVVTTNVGEVVGYMHKDDLGWNLISDCRTEVTVGQELEAKITHIKNNSAEIWLSRKSLLDNPISGLDESEIGGQTVEMVVDCAGKVDGHTAIYGHTSAFPGVTIRLPPEEVAWGLKQHGVYSTNVGEAVNCIVIGIDEKVGQIVVSKKRILATKWDDLRQMYPKGIELVGIAVRVQKNGVWCELEPGFIGFVPESEFEQAGREYAHFRDSMHAGDLVYVYIRKITGGDKQRASLGLQANLSRSR